MKASLSTIAIAGVLLLNASACTSATSPTMSAMPVPSSSVARENAAASCQPDFGFGVAPTSATITVGQTVDLGFKMTSLCGLAGTINVGYRVSPVPTITCTKAGKQQVCTSNGPASHQCCYDFPLPAGASTGGRITFGATSSTLKRTYTITVTGEDITGGCCYGITHSATVTLTVT